MKFEKATETKRLEVCCYKLKVVIDKWTFLRKERVTRNFSFMFPNSTSNFKQVSASASLIENCHSEKLQGESNCSDSAKKTLRWRAKNNKLLLEFSTWSAKINIFYLFVGWLPIDCDFTL